MPTTPQGPAVPAWRRHLEEDMTDAARELMGAGYVPSYYQQIAADFMPAAEGAVGEACAEAVATFREALARYIEAGAPSDMPTMDDRFDDIQVRPWARLVRDFKMEG